MTNLIKRLLHKIRISQVLNYVKKYLTEDSFLSKKGEVIIFCNSKIYAIWLADDILMLARPDLFTGSAFDFGAIEFLVSQITNDPYKEYGIVTREFFESLMPRKKKVKKEKEDKSRRKVRE